MRKLSIAIVAVFVAGAGIFFYLTAFMKGLPVSVWHSYQKQQATMQVKIASLFPIVDLRGRRADNRRNRDPVQ